MIRFLRGRYTREDLDLLQYLLGNALTECLNSEYSASCTDKSIHRVSADLASVLAYIDTLED